MPVRLHFSPHTRTVVRECCKGDDAIQWENGKFDSLPRPNPLTDRQKGAHVIKSWISTDMQNLVTIPQRVSFPICAKLRIKMFTRLLFLSGFFQQPTA